MFKTPLGETTTSLGKIEVYDSSNTKVLQNVTGLRFSVVPGIIIVSSAKRSETKTTIGTRSDYTVTFRLQSRLLSDSTIRLTLPFDQVTYDGSTT